MFRKIILTLLLLPSFCFSALELDVKEHVLDNGLHILMHEDHTVPIISYYSWVNVGSRYEKKGQTGIAHLFEHMMFQGTQKYGKKIFDKLVSSNGGEHNAFTSQDYTGYYINIPSSQLELVIDLESDRLVNLNVTKENLTSEREVVKEERRVRTDNNPIGKMYEAFFALTFPNFPYEWPVIGYMDDVNSLSVSQCQEFYKTYYSPNNTVVALVGDFDSKKALELFKKYYGSLSKQEIPQEKEITLTPQKKERRKTIREMSQNDMLLTAFMAVPSGHEDSYPLEVLQNVLSGGKSTRLYKRLIYTDQIVTRVYGAQYALKKAGMFVFFIMMKPGLKHNLAEKTLLEEIEKLKIEKISETELTKAKNQILSSYLFSLKEKDNIARNLGHNQIIYGDYRHFFTDIDRYNAVTPEDIQNVVKKYFIPERKNTVILTPS